MSYAKMNPTDIETMFEINPNDMTKMSSVEGGRPTFTTIYKFQKALNSQALSIPSTNYPDLGFLGEVIPVTQYTELNNGIAYVVPQNLKKSRYCSDIQSRCNTISNQRSNQVARPLRQ